MLFHKSLTGTGPEFSIVSSSGAGMIGAMPSNAVPNELA